MEEELRTLVNVALEDDSLLEVLVHLPMVLQPHLRAEDSPAFAALALARRMCGASMRHQQRPLLRHELARIACVAAMVLLVPLQAAQPDESPLAVGAFVRIGSGVRHHVLPQLEFSPKLRRTNVALVQQRIAMGAEVAQHLLTGVEGGAATVQLALNAL